MKQKEGKDGRICSRWLGVDMVFEGWQKAGKHERNIVHKMCSSFKISLGKITVKSAPKASSHQKTKRNHSTIKERKTCTEKKKKDAAGG